MTKLSPELTNLEGKSPFWKHLLLPFMEFSSIKGVFYDGRNQIEDVSYAVMELIKFNDWKIRNKYHKQVIIGNFEELL